jgi:hypothetical protein
MEKTRRFFELMGQVAELLKDPNPKHPRKVLRKVRPLVDAAVQALLPPRAKPAGAAADETTTGCQGDYVVKL